MPSSTLPPSVPSASLVYALLTCILLSISGWLSLSHIQTRQQVLVLTERVDHVMRQLEAQGPIEVRPPAWPPWERRLREREWREGQ